MNRRDRLIYWGGLLLLVLLFGIWGALYYLAVYVRDIPSRRMPLSSFFTGNVPRFYEWLSSAIKTIFWTGLGAFLAFRIVSIFLLGLSDGRAPLDVMTPLIMPPSLESLPRLLLLLRDIVWECLIGSDWRGAVATRFLGVIALYVGYLRARGVHWEWLRWYVLPSARNLARQAGGPNAEPQEELIRFLMDSEAGLNKGHWIVEAGELKPVGKAAGPASRFGGPGILIVQEGHAVILEKSGGVSRVVGRGITYLDPFERPTMVVKLHTQGVKLQVENAFTRDGGVIKKIEAFVFCRLDRGRASVDRGMRFPFDDALILERVWDPKHSDPKDVLRSICTTALLQVIAKHTLHEFFDDYERMRLKIRDELKEESGKLILPFLGFQVIAAAVNTIEVPPETEQKLWQRWGVVQDVTIRMAEARGEWQKAHIDTHTELLRAEASRMIKWAETRLEQEIRLLSAGTERGITERQALLQRGLDRARAEIDLEIKLLTATQDRMIRRSDADIELEIKKLTAAQDRKMRRTDADVDLEIKRLTATQDREMKRVDVEMDLETRELNAPAEMELKRLIASNDRLIRRLDKATDIEIDQDRRHALNESELERLKLLSEGGRYIESDGGDLRIELFARFVRMMQLAGHEPKEDTLRELAKILLTSRSPRGTTVALQRVLYRAITGRATSVGDEKSIDRDGETR